MKPEIALTIVLSGLWLGCAAVVDSQTKSDGGGTALTGVVTAPNGVDPLAGALIYVLDQTPPLLPTGVACDLCGQSGIAPSSVVASTTSGADGRFTLPLAAGGAPIDLYIQKGRWRRHVSITPATAQITALRGDATRLPASRAEGEMPSIAVALGDYDAIECVLQDLGVAATAFSDPLGSGSVHLYDNTQDLHGVPGTAVPLLQLLHDSDALSQYALLLIDCTEATPLQAIVQDGVALANLASYVAAGGRLYLSDWAYNLLAQQPGLAPFICFDDGAACGAPAPFQAAAVGTAEQLTGYVPTDLSLAQAEVAGLSTFLVQPPIGLNDQRLAIDLPLSNWVPMLSAGTNPSYPALTWLQTTVGRQVQPLTVSFEYPTLERSGACGRVVFSSPHARERPTDPAPGMTVFPAYCPQNITPQERVLEYMIFEVSSCLGTLQ